MIGRSRDSGGSGAGSGSRIPAERPPRLRAAGTALLALLVLALPACSDQGPQGPDAVTARVESRETALGSALVHVIGEGVQGFEGAGGSRVFARSAGTDEYRVLVVSTGSGELAFRILVEDVTARLPLADVRTATDRTNEPVPATARPWVSVER